MPQKLPEADIRRVFYGKDEFDKLLEHLPDYLQDVVRFTYVCGWRKSEVVGLRWEWVDRATRIIMLPTRKNGRGRLLALSGELGEIVKRREAARLVETPGTFPPGPCSRCALALSEATWQRSPAHSLDGVGHVVRGRETC